MPKLILVIFLSVFFLSVKCQNLRLSGNIKDTTSSPSVRNVLMMVLKFNDSSLVKFNRSGPDGIFKPLTVPRDTYLVIISHPSFSDRTYLLVPTNKDTAYNFKNVILPPKTVELNEIEIIAHKEKSYYKGDTLMFTADSFKAGPNATVEDLLKRLPGFKVDANGKITVQGKQVDQVLVDGDEFFGSDPTVATRNLNATSIENVQVYEKKSDNTEEGADEKVKVINLQMKDDAKKGYFGKVSGATDFQNYYEGEALINSFRKNRKVSLFGLAANTPKQGFGGSDIWKYGLDNEQQWGYDEDEGSWVNNGAEKTGVPQTVKGGFYFSDKFNKKTKVNADYTYSWNNLLQGSETNTQYFLEDTVFSNKRAQENDATSENHSVNLKITQQIDSLTELIIAPKFRYNKTTNLSRQSDKYFSENEIETRETVLDNKSNSENLDANVQIRINRNFMKKNRTLKLIYQPLQNTSRTLANINTGFRYYSPVLPDSTVTQEREQTNERTEQNISLSYVEPLTKKFKTELNYLYIQNITASNRSTYDYNGAAYDIYNPVFSNSFQNTRLTNRAGIRLIYDVKKYAISIGSNFRNIQQENFNRTNGAKLQQDQTIALPMASFNYRANQGSGLNIRYNSNSQLPDLQQMQPVIDNSDPNRLSLGNPDLIPSFSHHLGMEYYLYKSISDINLWSGINYNTTQDQVSSSTRYDELGRAITQPVNVDGNYFLNAYLGGGFPIFKRFMKLNYNVGANTNNIVTVVDRVHYNTTNSSVQPAIGFEKNAEKFTASIGGKYSYTVPKSTISDQANQPYYTYGAEAGMSAKLPKNFLISTDAEYTNNGNRSPGYNINYLIWNASFGKAFLKTENLIVSLNAYDILNQNISNTRQVMSNQIIDTKTRVITRYFLLKVLLKFNNQKTKVEDND